MVQKESRLDYLFQEFQSSFAQASPEEKERLKVLFLNWVEKQANPQDVQFQENTRDIPENPEYPLLTMPGFFTSKNRQEIIQDLFENEIHLRQIAENLDQIIWLRDIRSGQILYVSPAFEKVWGLSSESFYANPNILIDSVHPEDRVQFMVARPQNDHKPINQTYRILRTDGSMRWVLARTFVLQDENGVTSTLFCVAQDVTDQKQIELALRKTLDRSREQFNLSRKMSLARKSEAVLKTMMSVDGLHFAQRSALLFFDNPKAGPARGVEVLAVWTSSQIQTPWVGESNLYEEPVFWEIFQSNRTVVISGVQSDPRLTPLIRGFLLEGQIHTLVIFPLVALGNWFGCLLVYYTREYHFDRIELRHLKVMVDQAAITLYNLHLLEVEAESRHEAERANEIKTEFLAMISHELRTPLTSIVGFTNTLLAEDVSWEPEEQRDFLITIQHETDRLQELIDHLLDLSRLEAGRLPITLEAHTLDEIMEDALPQLRSLTERQTLTMHLPANLPPVNADAKRIAQVLVNLVRNASTYAPKGTEINISAIVRGNFLQINVSDQGPGIPPAERKRVFQAFRRGANVENGTAQGAGLGLAICKGLVEAHGGRIWIKKKTTPGATISFTIPLLSMQPSTQPEKSEN